MADSIGGIVVTKAKKDDVALVARSYPERQFVVVVDEAAIESAPEEGPATPAAAPAAAMLGMRLGMRFGGPAGALVGGVLGGVGGLVYADARKLEHKGVAVVPVGRQEAKGLTFPPGHPKLRVLYVGHPLIPTVYYPAAHFHRHTFEHKVGEAIRLLTFLGATEIEVERESGYSRKFAAKMNLALPLSREGKGRARMTRMSRSQVLYSSELQGAKSPRVPDGLVWYPHEEMWKSVAEQRLEAGLKNFNLQVAYEEDFGVDASLKGAVAGSRLSLGGDFDNHESTRWRMAGSFRET